MKHYSENIVLLLKRNLEDIYLDIYVYVAYKYIDTDCSYFYSIRFILQNQVARYFSAPLRQ